MKFEEKCKEIEQRKCPNLLVSWGKKTLLFVLKCVQFLGEGAGQHVAMPGR